MCECGPDDGVDLPLDVGECDPARQDQVRCVKGADPRLISLDRGTAHQPASGASPPPQSQTVRPSGLARRTSGQVPDPRCARCKSLRTSRGSNVRCPLHEGKPLPLLSARTVAYAHAVLRSALSDAVDDQIVARNVATLVHPPSGRSREIQPLTDTEVAQLLAEAVDDRLSVLWLTMLSLGLRLGEALALRWEDLDLVKGTVSISRSLQRQRGAADPVTGLRRGKLIESSPKTSAGTAMLPVPAVLLDALARHRESQREARAAALVWADPGLVFTTTIGSSLEPRNVHRAWTGLSDRAGVRRSRPHDLRHTTATFLLAEGIDLKVIQKTLRHSRYQTTADTYAHVAAEVQTRGAMAMDRVLRQVAPDGGRSGVATSTATERR